MHVQTPAHTHMNMYVWIYHRVKCTPTPKIARDLNTFRPLSFYTRVLKMFGYGKVSWNQFLRYGGITVIWNKEPPRWLWGRKKFLSPINTCYAEGWYSWDIPCKKERSVWEILHSSSSFKTLFISNLLYLGLNGMRTFFSCLIVYGCVQSSYCAARLFLGRSYRHVYSPQTKDPSVDTTKV